MNPIKTPITESGTITRTDSTDFGGIMALGAMIHTAKYDKSIHARTIQTDRAGLISLDGQCEGTLLAVARAVGLLGKMLAYTKSDELNDGDWQDFGWLLVSLGEISSDVLNAHGLVRDNLNPAEDA